MSTPTPRSRWRWPRRIAIALAALAAVIALIFVLAIKTGSGRELLRGQVEQRLAATFTGGATLGGVDGNPFGNVTLHDLVINGPDHRPAIKVKTLVLEVGILALMSHQARVLGLHADGVDVDLRRNEKGELVTQGLTRPGPPSAWSISLPEVTVRNAHVRFDTGREVMNFDGVAIDGWAKLPHGGPVDAGVDLRATWRERSAPLVVKTALRSDPEGLAAPYLIAKGGDVAVVGNQLKLRTAPPPGEPAGALAPARRMPGIGGSVFVNASAEAVARLFPDVRLPADFVVQVSAAPVPGSRWTTLGITGKVDEAPVTFTGTADLDARQLKGKLEAGALDITRLSGGKLVGHAAGTVAFDVRPGGPRALPIASATIRGWGELAGVPRTDLDIKVSSAGERAHAVVAAVGHGVRADLEASVRSVGEKLAIEGATLRATSTDPARASGGKAPVHGALQIDLRASGALRPAPDLAIAGTVEGQRLRMQDLSVSALHLAVDARQIPTRPLGKAHVQVVDLVRANAQLGELTVDAVDRPDGKLAVAVRSRPKANPWLIDADAVVTPPGDLGRGRFAIDLVGHHVRAGSGSDWYGKTGHIDITPERIALRDLTSKSPVGSIAVTGNFQRAGRHRGDLAANVDVVGLALDNLTGALAGNYRGRVDAHAAVTRTDGAWQGNVDVDGRGLSMTRPRAVVASTATTGTTAPRLTFDTQIHAGLHGRRLTVAANVASGEVGSVRVAIDADAPRAVAAPGAWQRLGRDAIRTAELTLRGVDVRRAAELAGLPAAADYTGKIDGGIRLTGDTTAGRIEVRDLGAPALRGVSVTAALELAQRSPLEITPRLTVTGAGVGNATAQAELEMPDRPFDVAAWRRLGRGALHGASVRSEGIIIEPGLLDRLGITSELRGRAGFSIDVGDAARTAQAVIEVGQLRGGQLVQPIDVRLTAGLDERTTTTSLTVASKGAPLIQVTGRLPVSLPELLDRRGDPAALKATPLSATAKLAQADAAQLLAVVGRTEITSGRIDGGIDVAGTLGKPTVAAKLVATKLSIPPGPHGKPVRTVDQMTITAGWDGTTAKLDIAGSESSGGTLKLTGEARPDRLRDGRLSIVAQKFDMVPILVFAPGPAGGSSGELDANLRLTGLDLRTSQIAGEVHLRDARIPTSPTVGTLRQAKIDAIVADHEIRIAVDGKLGGGSATMTGSIALDGAAPNGGQAKLKLNKISPIGSVEPQITADVNARLSRDRDQWHAELVVDNGYVVVPKNRGGEKLKPVGAPNDMLFANGQRITKQATANEHEPTNPIFLVNVDLRSTRVESEEFRGLIHGKLQLRADGEALAMYGGIEADRGDLDLFSRRYYVDRAAVNFDGSLDPLLNIRITHDFPDVTTVTEVRGRASKPELVMTSDPGTYSQGQLLGFLLGGEPGGDPQAGPLQSQVAGAGESYVGNQIGGYVKKALPIDIDVLRYEAATATSGAAITVGTWINSSLFLAYRQHLESSGTNENTGEGQIEYWLTRRLMVQGTVGDRADGLDLLWRKRY